MARELRIFGPPGTGKTTRLASQEIPKAVDRFGPDGVMVTSFTRAAAREIASRGLPVEERNVGTLHSMCFRSLGMPDLTVRHISKWNADFPGYALDNEFKGDLDEGGSEAPVEGSQKSKGTDLLSKLNILRNQLTPRQLWPVSVLSFEETWRSWKEKLGIMDFTDLIETALRDRPRPPEGVRVIFVDEAQDFTPLQLKLIRSWAVCSDWCVLVGDDDQTLYRFAGATPDAFLDPPIEDKYKRVLSQSYRVPRAIHQKALAIIKRVIRRENKVYYPREWDGSVSPLRESNYKIPDQVITDATKHVDSGRTVMILASCSYMLEPVKAILRREGIPFQNKYRRKRGDWNPLATMEGRISSAQLLSSFMGSGPDDRYWNIPQLLAWAPYLRVGDAGLARNVGKKALDLLKKKAEEGAEGLHTSREVLGIILGPAAIEPAMRRDTDWLRENLLKERQKTIEYPLAVLRRCGPEGLTTEPYITIGTIHSVKGGEADVVYLFPDISYAAMREISDPRTCGEATDSVWRMFYVGVTRAKEALFLPGPASPLFMPL